MKREIYFWTGVSLALVSLNVQAATGEYWEVTSKMEMPGMPFAMPAQKSKVCMGKEGESDPRQTQGKNCTFTDVQHSGNIVKFKGTCVNDHGDKMKVSGETSHDANSFKTKMQMSSADGGEMSMNSSGKRVGGSCDTDEIARKEQAKAEEYRQMGAKAQFEGRNYKVEACKISDPKKLLMSAANYAGASPLCSNRKEYCQAVSDRLQHEAGDYDSLVSQEEQGKKYAAQGVKGTEDVSIVRICNLDMASLKKTVCKNSAHRGPQYFMDKYCSATEAKEYREYARSQDDCGRAYTSQDQRLACMNLAKCGSDRCGPTEDATREDSNEPKTGTVLEGAKKLKGLLGF
jgi:hypothetical protein